MTTPLTADHYLEQLHAHQSDDELRKIQRYFKSGEGEYGEGDIFIGVRMGQVFALSKAFIDLPPAEIEKLLESPIHEVRAGAVSIMAKQAARKKTPPARKKELYDLYLRRIDRINNWDLVDLGARDVVGGYLADKPRDILYALAKSEDLWERRTAMLSTLYFARTGDLDDLFKIAEILVYDPHDLVHKAVGGMLRVAGDQNRPRLIAFLDRYAATMPRTALRYAIEHLEANTRRHYMDMKKAR